MAGHARVFFVRSLIEILKKKTDQEQMNDDDKYMDYGFCHSQLMIRRICYIKSYIQVAGYK